MVDKAAVKPVEEGKIIMIPNGVACACKGDNPNHAHTGLCFCQQCRDEHFALVEKIMTGGRVALTPKAAELVKSGYFGNDVVSAETANEAAAKIEERRAYAPAQ